VQPITADIVDKVRKQGLGGKLLDDGALRYVIFLNPVRMRPIRRSKAESMVKTVARVARSFDVVINGNYYYVDYYTGARAQLGTAAAPADTKVEGRVVLGGKIVAGDSRPDRFYIAEVMNAMQVGKKSRGWHYEVGKGNPPTGSTVVAGVGNLGPLVDDGLRYGTGNQYRPPAKGPKQGDPGNRLRSSLTQRNDNTFASVESLDVRTGKTIIAWHPAANALLVGVQSHFDGGPKRSGTSYRRIGQLLRAAGFTEAVFCDGSDSAMLWHGGKMIIAPGEAKANTMTIGIGFAQVRTAAPAARKEKR
jgi:hypothetical protein